MVKAAAIGDGSPSAPSQKGSVCYFSLRTRRSPLFLFSPVHAAPFHFRTCDRARAAAATARKSQDGGRGMAVKWRLGAWLRALRRRDFWSRFPRRSAAALCPLPGRQQPGAEPLRREPGAALLMHWLRGPAPSDFTDILRIFIREQKAYFHGVN